MLIIFERTMIFSSTIFLLYFLPIFLIVYQLFGKKYKNYVILIASIFFYSWGAPKFIVIILTSTILDFYIVKILHAKKDKLKRQLLLTTSIVLNLGLLAYFKYSNFFIENFNVLLNSFGFEQIGWTKVVLPIGISFYTFQTLTYSIDVYRGEHAPLKKLTDYLLYIMSFPQMIAGPIVRFNTIASQIVSRNETFDDKLIGFYRFSIGLAKKVLIANVMAAQAQEIFESNYQTLTSSEALLGAVAYTFQIYFDFSGYSDMAIGLGKMIGFKFPENFNSPYCSKSITEFWRKWHITLGAFMKDYLYIPLGGNKVRTRRIYFNLAIVFLLSGLWHGASWNFILWGLYHGVFLILDRLFFMKLMQKLGGISATIITFTIVLFGWIIFKIENLDDLSLYVSRLFSNSYGVSTSLSNEFWVILTLAIIFSFFAAFKIGRKIQDFFYAKESYSLSTNIGLSLISILLFVLALSSINSSDFNPFIYFRF